MVAPLSPSKALGELSLSPTASTASTVQVVTLRPGRTCNAHPTTEGLEAKFDVVSEGGAAGVVMLWTGANAFKASVNMESFEDRQRLRACVASNRKYDIAQPCTRAAFETSGRATTDATALLLINGTLTEGTSPSDYFETAHAADGGETLGKVCGGVPGGVSQLFLQGRKGNVVGGCYLFLDVKSMEEYLASDAWRSTKEATPWENVTVEKFFVATTAAAA